MLLEDIELLANITNPTLCCGAAELIMGSGSGQVILRGSQVQAQRPIANGFLISLGISGELLIEDSTF